MYWYALYASTPINPCLSDPVQLDRKHTSFPHPVFSDCALPTSTATFSLFLFRRWNKKKLRNTATLIILTNLKQMYTSTKLIQMKKKINKHTRVHAPSVGHNNRVFACFLPPATETMPHVFSHHSVVVVTGVTISAIILGTETYEHTSTHRSTITIARCCNESIASSSPFQNSGQY